MEPASITLGKERRDRDTVQARREGGPIAAMTATITDRSPRLAVVFGALLVAQGVHTAEHAIQLVQWLVLYQGKPQGLLGAWLGFEWVHFAFNTTVGLVLLLIFFGYRMDTEEWRSVSPVGWWAMIGALVIEDGLHVPEHVVRLFQYLRYGWDPAPGILGRTAAHGTGPFPLVPLHAAYNLVVTVLMAVAYVTLVARPGSGRR